MRIRLKFLAAIAPLLATSCTSVPAFEKEDYVHVADVLYSVECELKESVDYLAKYFPFAKKQLVQVIYQLRVAESGGGDGDSLDRGADPQRHVLGRVHGEPVDGGNARYQPDGPV